MLTEEEFKSLINESALIAMDVKSTIEQFERAKYNLMTVLTDYYRYYVYANKPLEDYSLTLVETAIECIKYFNPKRGNFLNLFNLLMKRNLGIFRAKEVIMNKRHGLVISGRESVLISKILAYAAKENIDIHDYGAYEKIALFFRISAQRVKRLIEDNDQAVGVESAIISKDGEEVDILESIASDKISTEDAVIEHDSMKRIIRSIDRAYEKARKSQKRFLSMLLTAEIIKAYNGNVEDAIKVIGGASFFSKEIIEYCSTNLDYPKLKEISHFCGTSEQSLCRAYKNFKAKIANVLAQAV